MSQPLERDSVSLTAQQVAVALLVVALLTLLWGALGHALHESRSRQLSHHARMLTQQVQWLALQLEQSPAYVPVASTLLRRLPTGVSQKPELSGVVLQLLDERGKVLTALENWQPQFEDRHHFDSNLIMRVPLDQGRLVLRNRDNGARYISVFQRFEFMPWTLVMHQPERQVLAHYHQQRRRYLWAGGLASLLALMALAGLLWRLHCREAQLRQLERNEQRSRLLLQRLRHEHRQTLEAASRDHLTGLYNRRLFMELAHAHLLGAKRQGRFAAVLFIDLDRFKAINDTLGHKVGDQLLQSVARRLNDSLRESDIISRFGGDEFVLMLTGGVQRDDIARIAATLVQVLAAPYAELAGSELSTSPSIGIALSPQDGPDTATLVKHADMAMYRAKQAGRGQYAFFDAVPRLEAADQASLARLLPDVMREQVQVYLQPRVSLPDYRLTGFEALVRWDSPEFGLLSPAQLLPLAESLSLMPALTEQVLAQACAQLVQWRADGHVVVPVAVNLGCVQLRDARLVERVGRVLERFDIDPAWLELEIAARDLPQLTEREIERLCALHQRGLQLTLDDVECLDKGLGLLEHLPFNRAKLSRAFIRDIRNSYDDQALQSAVISVAKKLKLQVAAKGVETPDQLVYLKLAGCDEVQGHLFGRALNAEEVKQYRQQGRTPLAV
ncbi:putative bifunctional diguanylate cyclase/phosphodiesterase [Marinobacterium weihaiense]|uniref:EAL domain-containing protein n=1 Tax=Marinobacterium weihaiense TaxID=2851016 RepID=A0ABS6MBE9_9GAMM|nr:EAL domain-containing protein [Marinobacterium weihaiense]MBV0933631.1 EAL domain-containing protein [Marinobacterium weihaiense]